MTDSEKIDEILNCVQLPEILVSCSEAARLCGVTQQTISSWIREGRLRKRTIGISCGIPLKEVIALKKPL